MSAQAKIDVSTTVNEFLKQTHNQFINGEWRDSSSGGQIEVENPSTEAIIAGVQAGSKDDIDSAVAAARAAFKGAWSKVGPVERSNMLNRYADILDENAEELAQIETLENGMPYQIALWTVKGVVVPFFRYYAGWPTKIEGSTIPASPTRQGEEDYLVMTLREPVGVAGAIIPWNAPSAMITLKLAPALAAGCTVVLKPAELTPLVAERFVQLAEQVGFPRGTINMVQGYGEDVGSALANHNGVDKIAFTGSTAVGKSIVRAAAGNLKKVTLELGGKSPFVVFPDANLEEAIPSAARACFFLSGQNCMAGTRLFVHEKIHDQFVEGVGNVAQAMKVGDGFEPDSLIGPLITDQQRQKVLGFVETGRQEGGEVVCGGNATGERGHFIEPTIVANTTPDMKIVREEVFGPVLAVQKFDDDIEALADRVNDTDYGLSGSVWTSDVSTALRMAKKVDSGQVGVNIHAAVSPETPFGGNKQSGWGREFGKEGLDPYLKTKAISIKI